MATRHQFDACASAHFPAAAQGSVLSPEGGLMSVPLPPAATPPSAEPSHHIHMAPSDRDARCLSAATRRASSVVVRRIAVPMSRRMLTPESSTHGGRVVCRRSSTGTSCIPARARAWALTSRQPVAAGSHLGAAPSAIARSVSFRCDVATQTSPCSQLLAARPYWGQAGLGQEGVRWSADGVSRDDAGGSPHLPLQQLSVGLRSRWELRNSIVPGT